MLTNLIPLLFMLAVLVPFVLTLVIAKRDHLNIRRAVRERLLNEHCNYQSELEPIPVNYSSELYFSQPQAPWAERLHLVDHEAAGNLFIRKDEIIFDGSTLRSHRPIQIRFESLNTKLRWAGRKLPKAMIYTQLNWFEMSQNSERHYFTAETGLLYISSKAKTSRIFQKLQHDCESWQKLR